MEGTRVLFETEVPGHRFDPYKLLPALVAHFGLSPEEIVTATLNHRKGRPENTGLLDVVSEVLPKEKNMMFTCGDTIHAFARPMS